MESPSPSGSLVAILIVQSAMLRIGLERRRVRREEKTGERSDAPPDR